MDVLEDGAVSEAMSIAKELRPVIDTLRASNSAIARKVKKQNERIPKAFGGSVVSDIGLVDEIGVAANSKVQ
jgi:hypothetical protein